MFKIEKKVYGERIRQARIFRGLSQTQLAELLNVSKQAISKYETNKSKLSTSVISLLPQSLGFPLSFFYKPCVEDNESKNIIFFRTKDIPKKTKEQLKEKINIMDEEIMSYFDKYIEFPKLNIPDLCKELGNEKYNYNRERIKVAARKLREYWKLKNEPIENLMYVLQVNGFIINKQHIEQDKTDAFSQKVDDRVYIFVSANKESAVRTRFDLAHELGHIILHSKIEPDEYGERSIEMDADYFASEFLYPSEVFIDEIQDYSLNFDTFIILKEKWKISIQAIIRKCKDLELISDDKYIYFQKRISYNNWRKREPLDENIVPEDPRLLKDAIEILIDNKIIDKKSILMDLDLDKKEIIELCNLPQNFFDETLQNVIKIY